MANAAGASTPSPPPRAHTPPAPRFGFHDNWEPFTPRKSARISSQRTANRTPSPGPPQRLGSGSPRNRKLNEQRTTSMVSPMPSPQKKRQPQPDSVRRSSAFLTAASAAQSASAPGMSDKHFEKPAKTTVSRAAGMLPTPSKTPQKPPNEKTSASISSFARNLFPAETAIASPRKKRAKQYSGMTLESFSAEEVQDPIEIFTDSQDKIPEKDESEANPFFVKASDPVKRRSKRRQVAIPGEGSQSVEDAAHRKDGMVYVFRGKRIFRKFSDDDESAHLRNSVKPRALFSQKAEVQVDDEEATTDMEEDDMEEVEEVPQTPSAKHSKRAQTPEAPKYAPVSPPDTKRVTRSTNKLLDEETPVKASGRRSPFDAWQRTKEHKAPSSLKRHGGDLANPQAKRTRS